MSAPDPSSIRALLERATADIRRLRAENAALKAQVSETHDRIAIVGMACRFPGGCDDLDGYFRFLLDGGDAVNEVPAERWPLEAAGTAPRGARFAGLLHGDIRAFDAGFFGIAPREAQSLDPQQRLLLEVTWHALEHAGLPPVGLAGSKCGVFIGLSNLDYQDLVKAQPSAALDAYCATGNLHSTAAGRIAYSLDLQGPCMTVDTACSSSLMAVHLAMRSLQSGECDVALAGGAHLILSALTMHLEAQTQALSTDGRCKTFDARADGFVRGEGCGMLVLKRHRDAERDGDRVLALLRGSAANQDGRSTGLTAPNVLSQKRLLRQALQDAGVRAQAVSYIEAHGTGTPLGDPIEVEALADIIGPIATVGPGNPAESQPCWLGTVKANLGHLEAAAGVAGLIKTVLALRHQMLPPHVHFQTLNPRIRLAGTRLRIATAAQAWPRGAQPRVAGVSSFGISGSNAHVIVEEAPVSAPSVVPSEEAVPRDGLPQLLTLSARSPSALARLSQAWIDALQPGGDLVDCDLADLAVAASQDREQHAIRRAVVGRSRAEWAAALAVSDAEVPKPTGQTTPRLVFVFPGQGSQWLGMGRGLFRESACFRDAITACEQALSRHVPWSLRAVLLGETDPVHPDRTAPDPTAIDVVQPLIFAMQVATSALLRSFGVEPDCVIGHSMGEVAAAHHAGLLDLSDAARIICDRSRLMRGLSGQGAMALLELPVDEVLARLAGQEADLSIAASNGPRATVLSGDASALDGLLAGLEADGIFCRRIRVDVASHSPCVDPLLPTLRAQLAGVRGRVGRLPLLSTVTLQRLHGPELDAEYFVQNLRQPVRLYEAARLLLADGDVSFVEISPHPILLPSIEEAQRQAGRALLLFPALRRETDEGQTLLGTLAALYGYGHRVVPPPSGCGRRRGLPLPLYPFDRTPYWIDTVPGPSARAGLLSPPPSLQHPILGSPLPIASEPSRTLFVGQVALNQPAYLADHRALGQILLPATSFVELAFAAARATAMAPEGEALLLRDLRLLQGLALHPNEVRSTQLDFVRSASGARFRFASRPLSAATTDAAQSDEFTLHATGQILVAGSWSQPGPVEDRPSLAAMTARCPQVVPVDVHYQTMSAAGIELGPCFQSIAWLRSGPGEALGCVRAPVALDSTTSLETLQAVLLDGSLQVAAAALYGRGSLAPHLPVAIAALDRYATLPREFVCHARLQSTDSQGACVDLDLLADPSSPTPNRLLATVRGLRLQRLPARAAHADPSARHLYHVAWMSSPLPATGGGGPPEGYAERRSILLFADAQGHALCLQHSLREQGHDCALWAPTLLTQPGTDLRALGERIAAGADLGRPPDAVVDLSGLDDVGGDHGVLSVQNGLATDVALVQALVQAGLRNPPRLYLLSAGGQPLSGDDRQLRLAQAARWGFGRTLMLEHPELRPTLIDLIGLPDPLGPSHPSSPGTSSASGSTDLAALLARLAAEILTDDAEDQVALSATSRLVARLRSGLPDADLPPPRPAAACDRAFRLEIAQPGVLDRLCLRAVARPDPGPGQVEIEVQAVGLNFLDVLLAMGSISEGPAEPAGPALGRECAGRVLRLGPGVRGLQVGDPVIAIVQPAAARYALADFRFVRRRPPSLSAIDAATLPLAFLTAYRALFDLARVTAGERVLIHAAAGGVGLASIQLCRLRRAEIFATAGSEAKRAYLRSLGIRHVYSSRDQEFAAAIRADTRGQGVDVVLNSLSGNFIETSLELLGPDGRFIEIGKRDALSDGHLPLRPFLNRLAYALVDLRGELLQTPDRIAGTFDAVLQLLAQGDIGPLPASTRPIAEATSAFVAMARGDHLGKLVLTLDQAHETPLSPPRPSLPQPLVRADRTYLITGGLGGLGLALAQWLVTQGARHLVLLGRGGLPASGLPADLQQPGLCVQVQRCDVTDRQALSMVLEQIAASSAPLGGVIHAAAVLQDGLLLQLPQDSLSTVLAPKVLGALHLHELTEGLPLDFFVLTSSAAALLGSPGQAIYSAANAALDALAHHRRSLGLPAASVSLGAVAEVGLAAASALRGERLGSRGIDSLSPQDNIAGLVTLLRYGIPHAAVLSFQLRRWQEFHLAAARSPFLSELGRCAEGAVAAAASEWTSLRERLRALPQCDRHAALATLVTAEVARVLRCAPTQLSPHTPLRQGGLDSLMAMELRNRLEARLGLPLSVTLIFRHPTITDLTTYLLHELVQAEPAAATAALDLASPSPSAVARDAQLAGASAPSSLASLDPATRAEPPTSEGGRLARLLRRARTEPSTEAAPPPLGPAATDHRKERP